MRSSVDALLLACFAAQSFAEQAPHGLKNKYRLSAFGREQDGFALAELGCGAGFCIAACLHLVPEWKGLAIDISPELTAACSENARRLELTDRLTVRTCDVRTIPSRTPAPFCDVLVCNPPYWETGAGRTSPDRLEDIARRGSNALTDFARAASAMLVRHGHFFLIYPAPRLVHLTEVLGACHFGIRRLRFVRSGKNEPAVRVLVEARRDMKHDTKILPDLVLYEDFCGGPRLSTEQARTFCPWLR